MDVVLQVLVTAVLSAALSGLVVWRLWEKVLLPLTRAEADRLAADVQRRAEVLADETVTRAEAELTAAGEALVPKFRRAVRDGIQDAVLAPPTERLGQTARGVTNAGVNVIEASLRRIFGEQTPPDRR